MIHSRNMHISKADTISANFSEGETDDEGEGFSINYSLVPQIVIECLLPDSTGPLKYSSEQNTQTPCFHGI